MATAAARSASFSTSGFEDGLGGRTLLFDREGARLLERLVLRPELGAFEKSLRERLDPWNAAPEERFARVRQIARDRETSALTVLSELPVGARVSDLLELSAGAMAGDATPPAIDVAIGFLLQAIPALSVLHAAGGFPHGAPGPGHVFIGADGQVMFTDGLYAQALERLQFSRRRLWNELRLAMAPAAGSPRFDFAADLTQVVMIAVSLALGRGLRDDEYPDGLQRLVDEVSDIAQIRGSAAFAGNVRVFLERTLPLGNSRQYARCDEALIDLTDIARGEMGAHLCRLALAAFVRESLDTPSLADDVLRTDPAPLPSTPFRNAHIAQPAITAALQPVHEIAGPLAATREPELTAPARDLEPELVRALAPEPEAQPFHVKASQPSPEPISLPVAVGSDPTPGEELGSDPAPCQDAALPQLAEPIASSVAVGSDPAPGEDLGSDPAPCQGAAVPQLAEPIASSIAVGSDPAPGEELGSDPAPCQDAALSQLTEPIASSVALGSDPAPCQDAAVPQLAEPIASSVAGGSDPAPGEELGSDPAPCQDAALSQLAEPIASSVAVGSDPVSRTTEPEPQSEPEPEPLPLAPPPRRALPPVIEAPPPRMPVYGAAAAALLSEPPRGIPITAVATPTSVTPQPVRIAVRRDSVLFASFEPRATRPEEDFTATAPTSAGSAPQGTRRVWWKLAAAVVVALLGGLAGTRGYIPEPASAATPVVRPVTEPPPALPSPTGGTLVLTSQPAGAKVLLDGEAAGETPLTLDTVKPGRHVLTFTTASGSVNRTVRIKAGESVAVDAPVFSGWLAVFSPIILTVSENGRSFGSSEDDRILLPPGRHTLTLANKQLGYSTVETVDIVPGEERRVTISPRGTLNVNAVPWAEVWIDGNRIGDTPLANLEVPLGTRDVVFRNPDFGERRVTVTVVAGTPAAISVDLSKQHP